MKFKRLFTIFMLLSLTSCSGNSSDGAHDNIATSSQVITPPETASSNVYAEDKESYCSLPENDSSTYWIEEFLINRLDPEIFTYQESNGFCTKPGCVVGDENYVQGWGNNELQYYTSCRQGYSKNCDPLTNTTENAFIENGYLKLQPIYDPDTPFEDPDCQGPECSSQKQAWSYTSARIMTSNKKIITPGTEVTVCFKVPEGSGHWPAIWMLPQGFVEGLKRWPKDGENDLVEHLKHHQAFEIQSTLHFESNGVANNIGQIVSVPGDVNFFDSFHSVTMKWQIDKIEYFLDTESTPYFSVSKSSRSEFNNDYWPFNENFYLILNVAAGGDAGGDPDISRYCRDQACSNLDDKDRARFLIDFIEIKSID